MTNKKNVLIVGGGVGGMAAAWWMARLGWQPTVLERAPALRNDGYMLGLSGPGYDVADKMGLLPELYERHRPIHENIYYGRDGELLWKAKYQDLLRHTKWITLSRTELVNVLYESVRHDADIRFGTTVSAIEQSGDTVEAVLSDGSTFKADLLIGADGVHSRTRKLMFGDEIEFGCLLGYRCAAFQIPDTLGLDRDFLSYAEPGRLTEIYTLSKGRLATLYAWKVQQGDEGPVPDPCAAIRSEFASSHPNVLKFLDALPDGQDIYFDDLELIEMPSWSKGRVLLLGDAAHCLTLISGQGAGMAITSACVLSQELAQHDIATALTRHEARLRPSIEQLQARSRKIAPLFIPATPRAFAFRNLVMRYSPRWLLAWYLSRAIREEATIAGGSEITSNEQR